MRIECTQKGIPSIMMYQDSFNTLLACQRQSIKWEGAVLNYENKKYLEKPTWIFFWKNNLPFIVSPNSFKPLKHRGGGRCTPLPPLLFALYSKYLKATHTWKFLTLQTFLLLFHNLNLSQWVCTYFFNYFF